MPYLAAFSAKACRCGHPIESRDAFGTARTRCSKKWCGRGAREENRAGGFTVIDGLSGADWRAVGFHGAKKRGRIWFTFFTRRDTINVNNISQGEAKPWQREYYWSAV